VRDDAWKAHDLRPLGPDWMDEPDPFGAAAEQLRTAGLRVNAWIVLTHNTRLGTQRPDVTVVNCFGEHYPYALCPAHPEVRDYAATLAAEAVREVAIDGVSLEACGQLGVTHLGHHEKTDGAWTPTAVTLLSICCCRMCRTGWEHSGLDADSVVALLREHVRAEATGMPLPRPAAILDAILAHRHANVDALRAEVLAALRVEAPDLLLTLHAHPDPWATGPSPGLTATAAADADALLVPAWPTNAASAALVRRASETGRPVDAYVTVLAPTEEATIVPHVERLRAAGASRFSLYHLGLAPSWRQPVFTDVVRAIVGDA
jgi:hypothetical protein